MIQAQYFHETVKAIEGDDISAVEILSCLSALKENLSSREADDFLSPACAAEKRSLISQRYNGERISSACAQFYGNFT